MFFERDPGKAAANLHKRRLRFADAISALEDERTLAMLDESSEEERWITIGMDAEGRILVAVYTWRGERIRIVSVRLPRANVANASREYEKEYDFSKGKRGPVIRVPAGKTHVTIRLDHDVLEWFRDQVDRAGGGNYQTFINEALREFIDCRRESLESTLRRVIREELRRAG